MSSVESRVRQIVAGQLGVDVANVNLGSSFSDDLGADSLDTVELVMTLEEEYGIEISDDDASKMLTVQDVVDYVLTHAKSVKQ